MFDRETLPFTQNPARRLQLGTNDVFVEASKIDRTETCQAVIKHRQLTGAGQEWYLETVKISLGKYPLKGTEETTPGELCDDVTDLARAAVGRLPR